MKRGPRYWEEEGYLWETVTFGFSGSLDGEELDISSRQMSGYVSKLQHQSVEVAREIEHRLESMTRGRVSVSIDFYRGSIDWAGVVRIVWPVVQGMSDAGGALALLGIIAKTIDYVLRGRLTRLFRRDYLPGLTATRAFVVSVQRPPAEDSRGRAWTLLGVATILFGLASMVFALGYCVSVLR